MQLTDKEDSLYRMLAILSLSGKSLGWSELINHTHTLAQMLDLNEDEIKHVITYYEEVNGISKKDSKLLIEGNNECWFANLLESNKTLYLNRYCKYLLEEK